jgi:hypothetical protein
MTSLMKAHLPTCLALALVLAGSVLTARAQTYSVDWYKVAGGGGTSTGSVYSVSGTIGQQDAGTMAGGNYTVDGGFWSVSVVQTPGAPVLTITRLGAGVILSWPSSATNYVLQQNGSVANAAGWTAYGGTVNDNGTVKTTTIASPSGSVYFRLMH